MTFYDEYSLFYSESHGENLYHRLVRNVYDRAKSDYDLHVIQHIDGLVEDCTIPIANALVLLQSYTKPSIYDLLYGHLDYNTYLFPSVANKWSTINWKLAIDDIHHPSIPMI